MYDNSQKDSDYSSKRLKRSRLNNLFDRVKSKRRRTDEPEECSKKDMLMDFAAKEVDKLAFRPKNDYGQSDNRTPFKQVSLTQYGSVIIPQKVSREESNETFRKESSS